MLFICVIPAGIVEGMKKVRVNVIFTDARYPALMADTDFDNQFFSFFWTLQRCLFLLRKRIKKFNHAFNVVRLESDTKQWSAAMSTCIFCSFLRSCDIS